MTDGLHKAELQETESGNIDGVLDQREQTHGDYQENTMYMQGIKSVIRSSRNYPTLPADMRESLEMFAHKMGRILGGDPNVKDHWVDIEGYAKLISRRLK